MKSSMLLSVSIHSFKLTIEPRFTSGLLYFIIFIAPFYRHGIKKRMPVMYGPGTDEVVRVSLPVYTGHKARMICGDTPVCTSLSGCIVDLWIRKMYLPSSASSCWGYEILLCLCNITKVMQILEVGLNGSFWAVSCVKKKKTNDMHLYRKLKQHTLKHC